MERMLTGAAVSMLLVSLAWGASSLLPASETSQCHTRRDVERDLDRSRNGISQTCTEAILRAALTKPEQGARHE